MLIKTLSLSALIATATCSLPSAAEDIPAPGSREYDYQYARIISWDELYRTTEFTTPQNLPEFLTILKNSYLAEATAFIDREPELANNFKYEYEALIDKHFQLLARYYYLQLQYGKLCYGTAHPADLEKYRNGIETDITRLAWQMLKECVWCEACIWTGGADASHPVNQAIDAIPQSPDFGNAQLLSTLLSQLLDTKALNNADIRSYGALMSALRASRIYDIADILACLNQDTWDNLLTSTKWSSEEEAKKAASLIIQQFDTCNLIKHNAIEGRLYIPSGLGIYVGTSHSYNTDIFYTNQEAFLHRALNFEVFQQNTTIEANQEKTGPHAENTVQSTAATQPSQTAALNLLWLSVPTCVLLGLLAGVVIGRRLRH